MRSSDSEPLEQQEADWDDWDADADLVQCLFSDQAFATADEALDQDARQTGFDLRLFRSQVPQTGQAAVRWLPLAYSDTSWLAAQRGLDDLDTIRLINFCRSEVQQGRSPAQQLLASLPGERHWQEDRYLQPVLPDDGLLTHDFADEAPPG